MFNVSKKTVSLVLCLTLIASVVVFCFAGPASAVTNTIKYPVYDEAISLAAKPEVNLDFEGDNYYGIPFNRGSTIKFNQDGFATVSNGGGWFFVGNNGTCPKYEDGVDITSGTVTNNDKEDAKEAYVVNNYLYELKRGKTYKFVMKYKFLAGSYIKPRSIGINVFQNPHKKTTDADKFADFPKAVTFVKGNSVVWKTGGVVQEGRADTVTYTDNGVSYTKDVKVLETDTDVQTMTAYITLSDSAITSDKTGNASDFGPFYLGLQNYYGGYTPNFNATLAIDSIEIYDLTKSDSAVQDDIAFDNGGIGINRYYNSISYGTEENGNKYAVLKSTGDGSAAYASNYEYGTSSCYSVGSSDDYKNKAEEVEAVYGKTFRFQPGHSYEVTFKYRYSEDASVTVGKSKPMIKFAVDPCGVPHSYDDLFGTNSWAKDITSNGLVLENDPSTGKWQTVKLTFTVKKDADIDYATAGYVRNAEGMTLEAMGGACLGIRVDLTTIHIDDYCVRELIGYRISSFNTQNVSLDFDNTMPTDVTCKNATVTYGTNENTGSKYMEVTAKGNARISMAETRVLKMNKKYYISFDAKSENGCTNFNLIMGNKASDYRIFLTDPDPKSALNSSGSKFYINGKDVNGYDNFKPNGEWRHYGFTLNLDYEKWNNIQSSGNTVNDTNWQNLEAGGGVYLLFGAGINQSGTSICYDNIKITQFDELADAVPATTDKVERDDYTASYVNHFDSITTSNLIQNTADTAAVEADAAAPERGNVIKLSSSASRFTLKNSDILEKGYKYTVSFDGKLDPNAAAESGKLWLMMASDTSTNIDTRFILRAASDDGCTAPAVLDKAFKLYIDGNQVLDRTKMDITKEWQTFTIEIDYTNEELINVANLSKAARYFHFGCANGWFDNFKIIKRTEGTIKESTQASIRQASGEGENYVSAGLRFKNCLPNEVVAAADEVGFVVIPSSMATQAVKSWYMLDGNGHTDAKKVVCKDNSTNRYYEKTGFDTYYQLVLTGLSTESGKTAYNRRFSAVMYVKNGENYTYYALGETSYNNVNAISEVLKKNSLDN